MESELWHTIRDFGESLVDDCSKSRLIYHFNASYFEPIESQLKMREDWISYSDSIILWTMMTGRVYTSSNIMCSPHNHRNLYKVFYLN